MNQYTELMHMIYGRGSRGLDPSLLQQVLQQLNRK